MARDEPNIERDWSLAEAKDRLSEVVRRARSRRPQTISVRGERAVVVLAVEDYDALTTSPHSEMTLKDLIRAMNLEGVDLTRDPRPTRDIDL